MLSLLKTITKLFFFIFICFAFWVSVTPTSADNPGITKVINKLNPGDKVLYGHYFLNSIEKTDPIEWIVLDVIGNKALLLSRFGLDAKPFNENDVQINWEHATLRKWLNKEFFNFAFTEDEQKNIQKSIVINNFKTDFNTLGGNNTQDHVFLLSTFEVKKYLSSDQKILDSTSFAKLRGTYVTKGDCTSWWWVRDPGNSQDTFVIINGKGEENYNGIPVNDPHPSVRPAIWVEL